MADIMNIKLGNQLAHLKDKDIQEVFEQYARQKECSKSVLLRDLEDILYCAEFDKNRNRIKS